MAKTLRSEIPDQFGGVINEQALERYVSRIENLHNERKSLNEDIKEVYGEAKDAGFDTTILREIVRERQMEEPARHSRYALLEAYRRALGMLADTPLGQAAMDRAEAIHAVHPGNGPKRGRKPRFFAEQPVHQPRPRGRPRKNAGDALANARAHLGEEPAGTA
jgi:uncharacterized protein (UPF0335 family)